MRFGSDIFGRRGAGRSGRSGRSCRCGVGRADLGRPGPYRSPGPCLVLRSVLARVRIFLRVERPVGAARRPVPAGAAPVWLERPIGAVIRGRSERGLVSLRPARPAGVRVRGRSPIGTRAVPRGPASTRASRRRPSRARSGRSGRAGSRCGAARSGSGPVCRGAIGCQRCRPVPPGRGSSRLRRPLQLGSRRRRRASRSVGPEHRHRPSRPRLAHCAGARHRPDASRRSGPDRPPRLVAARRGPDGHAPRATRRSGAARRPPGWRGTGAAPPRRRRPGDGPWPVGGRRA